MKAKVRHHGVDPVNPIRHSPRRITHPVRRAVLLSLTAAMVFAASGAGFAYAHLLANIRTGDANKLMNEAARPVREGPPEIPGDPFTGRALNIVLIGSDSRAGGNAKIAKFVDGMRSDTAIVAHIAQDRSRIDLVSFPRDMMLEVAACTRSDGSETAAGFMQFNWAFENGGKTGDVTSAAACTMTAIEGLTNIRLDGFIAVDMAGFAQVIQAIGGVDLCIPKDIDSPKARLKLKAGMRHLDGKTALKYSRARTGKGLGDGSDLRRIERQQKLLGAVSREILSSAVLASPPKLYGTLDAITQSLTMTKEFADVQALAGLGLSLSSLDKANIAFITVPNAPYPADTNRVIPVMSKAEALFKALRKDKPIEGTHAWQVAHGAADGEADRGKSGAGDAGGGSGSSSSDIDPSSPGPDASTHKASDPAATQSANPFDARSASSDPDVCKSR